MKSIFTIVAMVLALATFGLGQESLGDAARKARMHKPVAAASARVITNENLPSQGGLGYVSANAKSSPQATEDSADEAAPAGGNTGKSAEKKSAGAAGEAAAAEDPQKKIDEWSSKIADQKKEVSQLERELNVLVRERQLRAAAFYADAGNRLRDQKNFDQTEVNYQNEMTMKQKALADAKQTLGDMQEQARKAGVPASARE